LFPWCESEKEADATCDLRVLRVLRAVL